MRAKGEGDTRKRRRREEEDHFGIFQSQDDQKEVR